MKFFAKLSRIGKALMTPVGTTKCIRHTTYGSCWWDYFY